MKKGVIGFFLIAGIAVSCMEIEEINSSCEVYIIMDDGSLRFYEISEDVRRNKNTGVFTYRDEEGKLWSITQNPDSGNWFSNSQGQDPRQVERIVCGDKVYLEQEEEDRTEEG
ncbi:hypothetical protein [Cecembia sp.]|uniref:hypothetical protein n=1 Tax=Cecembia sp. TaxID=1898110 RepID=UPI0025C17BED|nr:hypothetical protein [Cecembia sp.]